MDAVEGLPVHRKVVLAKIDVLEKNLELTVSDRGRGISPRIFQDLRLILHHETSGHRTWIIDRAVVGRCPWRPRLGRKRPERRRRFPSSAAPASPPSEGMMQDTPLIHVVDDDASFRTSLIRLLSSAGFDAKAYASTGDFLLEFFSGPAGLYRARRSDAGSFWARLAASAPQSADDVANCVPHGQCGFAIRHSGDEGWGSRFPLKAGRAGGIVRRQFAVHCRSKLEHGLLVKRSTSELPISVVCQSVSATFLSWSSPASSTNRSQLSLGISERTVKAQRATAMTKLQAELAADLGRLAEQLRQLGIEIG